MESEKYFEKIEAFLQGEMPPGEAKAFRKELADQPSLQEAFLRHRLANHAVEMVQDAYLKEKLQEIRKEYGPLQKPEVAVFSLRKVMARAAAVLILVIAGAGIYAQLNHSDEALIRQNYEQASSPTIAGEEEDADARMNKGLYLYYQDKNYAQALSAFSGIPSENKNYNSARYFIAHCQLKTKDFASAEQNFNSLISEGAIPAFAEQEEIEWNLLLAKLGMDKEEEAQNMLQEILENPTYSTPMKEQAEALNKKLNSFWRKLSF